MSSESILQRADAALREAVNILHEKGSTGSGELSHAQALELLDVQQNLRKEHGDLKQAIRSGSTGWFSRSSSTSATVHLEQCQGLVQRIQVSQLKHGGQHKERTCPSAANGSGPRSTQSLTPEGEDDRSSAYVTAATHLSDTPPESSTPNTNRSSVPQPASNRPAPTPTARPATGQSQTPQPTTSKRAKAGGFALHHNSMVLDNNSTSVGATMNVGGSKNTGSVIHGYQM
ncbi:hypothetical protein BU15DRAFT_77048 [Melanogaster broomeanus]|nr:hypothetical protein BU15DRAFT_77048 [Melanogaster broomeanus]